MPKLLYSSERFGCGATIELASGDICIVSVAQIGVRVRSYRKGLFGSLFGGFIGPILFNEKNVYVAAKTAVVLHELFPDYPPSLNFKNPVLAAFAGAVWTCSSAAEVSCVLNEAAI
jgi:hypothetical protein